MGRAFGAPEPSEHGQTCFFQFPALVGLATREPWNTSGQKVQDPGQRFDFFVLHPHLPLAVTMQLSPAALMVVGRSSLTSEEMG
jgi:hypothetical protein